MDFSGFDALCALSFTMRSSLGSITCKALRAVDRITTVGVVVDDTALSFRDVSLFLFPIRTRLPIGTSLALASSLDIYIYIYVFSFGPGSVYRNVLGK